MRESLYEFHNHRIRNFYHFSQRRRADQWKPCRNGWHGEHGDPLFFHGALPSSDMDQMEMQEGDLAVINSSNLHEIEAVTASSHYFCLIPIKVSVKSWDFISMSSSCSKICVRRCGNYFFSHGQANTGRKAPYYKAAVKVKVGGVTVYLSRHYVASEELLAKSSENYRKLMMVKEATAIFAATCGYVGNRRDLRKSRFQQILLLWGI